MGNIHLVTGYAGHQHITSADQAVFNALTFGNGQYVLTKGNRFAASIVTNNQVNVLDGDIYMQGRHIRLNESMSVDLTIENGTQGYSRNDLIVVRYTKDENTGIEDANLVVIKGVAVTSDPADPEYTSGDLVNDNANMNDMPLYRVQLSGLNISALVPLFDTVEINLMNHANRHAIGGSDVITPAMIDAADRIHTHTAEDVGAVSKSGDTMNVGAKLNFKAPNGTGLGLRAVSEGINITAFDNADDESSNRAVLRFYSPSTKEQAEALRMAEVKDGKTTWSTILHTGNMNSLYPAANVVTGSYVGTGTSGENNKNSVVLPEEPTLFVVSREHYANPMDACGIRAKGSTILATVTSSSTANNATWNKDTSSLEWYNVAVELGDNKQFNTQGYTFFYVAIY